MLILLDFPETGNLFFTPKMSYSGSNKGSKLAPDFGLFTGFIGIEFRKNLKNKGSKFREEKCRQTRLGSGLQGLFRRVCYSAKWGDIGKHDTCIWWWMIKCHICGACYFYGLKTWRDRCEEPWYSAVLPDFWCKGEKPYGEKNFKMPVLRERAGGSVWVLDNREPAVLLPEQELRA